MMRVRAQPQPLRASEAELSDAITPVLTVEASPTVTSPGSTVTLYGRLMIPREQGDVNQDGRVSLPDLSTIGLAYGTSPGDPYWNPDADLNNDGRVDLSDLVIAAKFYGQDASGKLIQLQQWDGTNWVTIDETQTFLEDNISGKYRFNVKISDDVPTPSVLYFRVYFPGGIY